ncbi:hypothetical protein R4Y45_07150 [Holzapfeliella sp. He02]|uniref:Uncharacterized protein n=1 Tax=Holzapfeliella saturejae TaxID=3082953 RepID=A0ABU8SHY2_9LACO
MKNKAYQKYYRSSLYFFLYGAILLVIILLNMPFKGFILNNPITYCYFLFFFMMELPVMMNFGISNQMTRHQIAKNQLKQVSIIHLILTACLPLTLFLFGSPFKLNLLYMASFFIFLTFSKLTSYVLILIISLIQDTNIKLILIAGVLFGGSTIGGFMAWWQLGDATLSLAMQSLMALGLSAATVVLLGLYLYLMQHVSVYTKLQK